MKNSISNIWLLGIIIVFILIFAAYIIITINYTQSFKYKNEVLNIIEKHHGITSNSPTELKSVIHTNETVYNAGSLEVISLYLLGNAYTAEGYCPEEIDESGNKIKWYGVYDMNWDGSKATQSVEEANTNRRYNYCFSIYNTGKISKYSSAYFKVRLFYKFEFPVLSEFLSIKVDGLTDEIYSPTYNGYTANSLKYFTGSTGGTT